MTIYRLVAYHNTEIKRECIDFSNHISSMERMASTVDPVKFKNYHLVIEVEGETISTFKLQDGKFTEVIKEQANE